MTRVANHPHDSSAPDRETARSGETCEVCGSVRVLKQHGAAGREDLEGGGEAVVRDEQSPPVEYRKNRSVEQPLGRDFGCYGHRVYGHRVASAHGIQHRVEVRSEYIAVVEDNYIAAGHRAAREGDAKGLVSGRELTRCGAAVDGGETRAVEGPQPCGRIRVRCQQTDHGL